jgi:hypothetical protein
MSNFRICVSAICMLFFAIETSVAQKVTAEGCKYCKDYVFIIFKAGVDMGGAEVSALLLKNKLDPNSADLLETVGVDTIFRKTVATYNEDGLLRSRKALIAKTNKSQKARWNSTILADLRSSELVKHAGPLDDFKYGIPQGLGTSISFRYSSDKPLKLSAGIKKHLKGDIAVRGHVYKLSFKNYVGRKLHRVSQKISKLKGVSQVDYGKYSIRTGTPMD